MRVLFKACSTHIGLVINYLIKVLKKKKLKKTKKTSGSVLLVKPGDRVVTETLATRSQLVY